VPDVCWVLGPCPHFNKLSQCWRRTISHDHA
jgi:hypothetical protein